MRAQRARVNLGARGTWPEALIHCHCDPNTGEDVENMDEVGYDAIGGVGKAQLDEKIELPVRNLAILGFYTDRRARARRRWPRRRRATEINLRKAFEEAGKNVLAIFFILFPLCVDAAHPRDMIKSRGWVADRRHGQRIDSHCARIRVSDLAQMCSKVARVCRQHPGRGEQGAVL